MCGPSLFEHANDQLARLCRCARIDPELATQLLSELLGSGGSRPLSERPAWPSNVADDHAPVEFSVAFGRREYPTVRMLGEAVATCPGRASNLAAATTLLSRWASRLGRSMARFDRVQDLFVTDDPQGLFGMWHSIIFRNSGQPELKVYFNPEIRGTGRAADLVAEALCRLGLSRSWQMVLDHAVRPGELGRGDRLAFFALDLGDGPRARVKLYIAHDGAEARDVVRAADAVDGIAAAECVEFCDIVGGGAGPFDGRPLVGSYTFFEGAEAPVGYSLYVPVRSYVEDDAEARDRVAAALDRYGFDPAELDEVIRAVARRPLGAGVGLLTHASLRLGSPYPGVTVYLSTEAYGAAPPRRQQVGAPACERDRQPAVAWSDFRGA
ncbi:MAG: hypothetical protein JXA67_21705 [Micromonosporaceae bacterium]|nr:hypothetical protein [Micromonosporaceae bacterium]